MPNQFLVEIHDYLDRQIDAAKNDRDDARSIGDQERLEFSNGKLDELEHLRDYVSRRFDLLTQKYY